VAAGIFSVDDCTFAQAVGVLAAEVGLIGLPRLSLAMAGLLTWSAIASIAAATAAAAAAAVVDASIPDSATAAAGDGSTGSGPRLLQLPFGLLQRIAQHLCDDLTAASSSSSSSSEGASCALQELSCTCTLLRQAVLATLPQLTLTAQQLGNLAACQHTFTSAAVLTLEVRPPLHLGQVFSSTAGQIKGSDQAAQQTQPAAAAAAAGPYSELLRIMPRALMRLPYVRHIVLRGISSGLLPLLQPLQQLPHLQDITIWGRKGKLGLLPAVLAHCVAAAALPGQSPAAAASQCHPAGAPSSVIAADRSARRYAAQPHLPLVQPAAAEAAAGPKGSYKAAVLRRLSSSSSSSSKPTAVAMDTPPSSSSSSSSSNDQAGELVCQAASMPRSLLPLQNLSCLRKLTLRRLNLCSVRYSSGGSSSSSSSSRTFCPLSMLAQHLTRLQALCLQQVTLDRASLASLAGKPGPALLGQAGDALKVLQPLTGLRSTLQVRWCGAGCRFNCYGFRSVCQGGFGFQMFAEKTCRSTQITS
jgi:hypothetical protein